MIWGARRAHRYRQEPLGQPPRRAAATEQAAFRRRFFPVKTVAYRALPDGDPDDWIESLKQVEQLDFDILVPGHGKVGKKELVRLFREYLEALRSAVSEQVQKGASLDEAKKAVRLPQYEQWYGYTAWFTENVEGMYRYLSPHTTR